MTEQQKSTLRRAVALFLAAGAGDALVQYFQGGYDSRHLLGAMVVAGIMAFEKWTTQPPPTT